MRQGWPLAGPGRKIGLLRGSFDPPHNGHAHITREALKRFGLDEVWWLVSPGNPLKRHGPAPLSKRLEASRRLMAHPRVRITALESSLGTRFTAETIAALQANYPGVCFVWLMGADNLAGFHKWENWREIASRVPIGVLARPEQRISARMSPAARQFRLNRLQGRQAKLLSMCEPPTLCFVNVPMIAV